MVKSHRTWIFQGSICNLILIDSSYLLPTNNRSSKQKTPVCRKTVSPRWEHTLRWDDVTLTDLASFSLELTVWDHDRVPGRHSECLGGARFNLGTGNYSIARKKREIDNRWLQNWNILGKHRGRVVAWMDASEKEINLWQQMLDRPNFWVEGSVYLRAPERVSNNQALQNWSCVCVQIIRSCKNGLNCNITKIFLYEILNRLKNMAGKKVCF